MGNDILLESWRKENEMSLEEAKKWLNEMKMIARACKMYHDESSGKKAEAIETVLNYIEHESVSKEKVQKKIKEIISNNPANEDWNGTDYIVTSEEDFAIEKLEELL